uniref:General secretion pathway protein D n=1 Tax=Candidatus Kentrum eta TaxID=2126337 RepID=A0A450UU07_9GAMM|nr:MAG: general secretion pathway protein D [Candidatus Kentron sp. H]VFJ97618.1 MAG: general secretion pathway protein D [Candidatus Kentron sp. H]VFK03173.1 MAG: general secretion pathway protein D [Candidatus Kentron sp. H]
MNTFLSLRFAQRGHSLPPSGILPSLACLLLPLLTACATPPPSPYTPSPGHIREAHPPDVASPEPVRHTPVLPSPTPSPPPETYTIVVNEVPTKELLFALARDAAINIDIHPGIQGVVTVNAIDQTLPEILARIESQAPIRHEFRDTTLAIMPDTPFLKTYRIDYVNMTRTGSSEVKTSTKIATSSDVTGMSEENASGALLTNTSANRFWETLSGNIEAILGQGSGPSERDSDAPGSDSVIVNAETGLITVRATTKQHRDVRAFIEQVMTSAQRQVLIESTIVEVELNDRYQAGIDWETFTTGAGLQVGQAVSGAFSVSTEGTSGLTLNYADAAQGSDNLDLSLTLRLLRQFGQVRVLSSPKILTLNNQTALLKVVDNEVYFELEVEETEDEDSNTLDLTVKSKVKTVPVGLLMNVTPHIDHRDSVTLNVRPTITRIKEYREDPGVAILANRLADSDISSPVPVVQVRETESVLAVKSRKIAIIGGLMQDRVENDTDSVPWLGDLPGIGNLFTFRHRHFVKTELVIFLRPTVIRTADIRADLSDFRAFLPK